MKILVVLGLLLSVGMVVPTAQADEPTRIMVVGDSVTHSSSGEYSWRYFAWKGLEQTGAAVDFVGPHTGTNSREGYFAGSYAAPDFDQDHASRFGLSMWETLYKTSDIAPSVDELMTNDPDVIVETLGLNDLNIMNMTPETTAAYVREFVTRARAIKPDVDFVIGSLPQTWYPRVPGYNALLPDLVEDLSTPESRVVLTPVASFVNGVDTYDSAHPTTLGQRKIAEAVSAGLEELGIGQTVLMPDPTAPIVVTPTPTPTSPTAPEPVAEPAPVVTLPQPVPAPVIVAPIAPRRVKAIRVDKRVVVTWTASADSYRVSCGTKRTDTTGSRWSVRTDATRCKVRAMSDTGMSPWVRASVKQRR